MWVPFSPVMICLPFTEMVLESPPPKLELVTIERPPLEVISVFVPPFAVRVTLTRLPDDPVISMFLLLIVTLPPFIVVLPAGLVMFMPPPFICMLPVGLEMVIPLPSILMLPVELELFMFWSLRRVVSLLPLLCLSEISVLGSELGLFRVMERLLLYLVRCLFFEKVVKYHDGTLFLQ